VEREAHAGCLPKVLDESVRVGDGGAARRPEDPRVIRALAFVRLAPRTDKKRPRNASSASVETGSTQPAFLATVSSVN
jgi:hypothetical protein